MPHGVPWHDESLEVGSSSSFAFKIVVSASPNWTVNSVKTPSYNQGWIQTWIKLLLKPKSSQFGVYIFQSLAWLDSFKLEIFTHSITQEIMSISPPFPSRWPLSHVRTRTFRASCPSWSFFSSSSSSCASPPSASSSGSLYLEDREGIHQFV
jgi:hypothetical protein